MRTRYLLFVGLALLAISSCRKVEKPVSEEDTPPETPVVRNSPKFAFAATADSHKWFVGEQVRIFLHAHGDAGSQVEFKDYSVTGFDDADKSMAYLDAVQDSLKPITGQVHDFYSLYPAGAISDSNTSFKSQSGSFTITLPETRYVDDPADMQDEALMAAVSTGRSAQGRGAVILDFHPMVSSIFVTIRNNSSSHQPIDIRKVGLKQTNKLNNGMFEKEKRKYYLSGTYDLKTGDDGSFSYSSGNFRNGSTYAGVAFEPYSLAYGDVINCALFILPQSLDAGELKLTVRTTRSVTAVSLAECGISTVEPGQQYQLELAIDEKDVLVSSNEVTDNARKLVAKLVTEKIINFAEPAIANVLDDVTAVYAGSGSCEIVNNTIQVLVDNDEGTRVWRDLTDDEIRYLAGTVKGIDLHESLFQPGTTLTAEDLSVFCNLEKIQFLNLNNVSEIHISDMEKLQEVNLHQGGVIRIEDCPSLQRVSLESLAGAQSVLFKNLPAMNSFSFTGNGAEQAQDTDFEFSYMGGLETIEFERVKSVTVNNCPELTTLTIRTPANTTKAVTIIDAPKLRNGVIGRQRDYVSDTKISVTLTNCSEIASGSPVFDLYYRDSGRHPVYSITSSSRLSIRNHRWDYGRNRDVVDADLQ